MQPHRPPPQFPPPMTSQLPSPSTPPLASAPLPTSSTSSSSPPTPTPTISSPISTAVPPQLPPPRARAPLPRPPRPRPRPLQLPPQLPRSLTTTTNSTAQSLPPPGGPHPLLRSRPLPSLPVPIPIPIPIPISTRTRTRTPSPRPQPRTAFLDLKPLNHLVRLGYLRKRKNGRVAKIVHRVYLKLSWFNKDLVPVRLCCRMRHRLTGKKRRRNTTRNRKGNSTSGSDGDGNGEVEGEAEGEGNGEEGNGGGGKKRKRGRGRSRGQSSSLEWNGEYPIRRERDLELESPSSASASAQASASAHSFQSSSSSSLSNQPEPAGAVPTSTAVSSSSSSSPTTTTVSSSQHPPQPHQVQVRPSGVRSAPNKRRNRILPIRSRHRVASSGSSGRGLYVCLVELNTDEIYDSVFLPLSRNTHISDEDRKASVTFQVRCRTFSKAGTGGGEGGLDVDADADLDADDLPDELLKILVPLEGVESRGFFICGWRKAVKLEKQRRDALEQSRREVRLLEIAEVVGVHPDVGGAVQPVALYVRVEGKRFVVPEGVVVPEEEVELREQKRQNEARELRAYCVSNFAKTVVVSFGNTMSSVICSVLQESEHPQYANCVRIVCLTPVLPCQGDCRVTAGLRVTSPLNPKEKSIRWFRGHATFRFVGYAPSLPDNSGRSMSSRFMPIGPKRTVASARHPRRPGTSSLPSTPSSALLHHGRIGPPMGPPPTPHMLMPQVFSTPGQFRLSANRPTGPGTHDPIVPPMKRRKLT